MDRAYYSSKLDDTAHKRLLNGNSCFLAFIDWI